MSPILLWARSHVFLWEQSIQEIALPAPEKWSPPKKKIPTHALATCIPADFLKKDVFFFRMPSKSFTTNQHLSWVVVWTHLKNMIVKMGSSSHFDRVFQIPKTCVKKTTTKQWNPSRSWKPIGMESVKVSLQTNATPFPSVTSKAEKSFSSKSVGWLNRTSLATAWQDLKILAVGWLVGVLSW